MAKFVPGGRLLCSGLVLALFSLGVHAQQTTVTRPARPEPPRSTAVGTAAITGTAVDAITGRPVAGAMVVLEDRRPGASAPVQSFVQVTTPTGRFAFVDLPASERYTLVATKEGYLGGGYRRADPQGPSAPMVVAEGQWVRDVLVTLPRPGSISGTVRDERDEPVVGARVRVLPQVLMAGQTQWLAGAVAVTDDRGAYRIAGLGPGRYVVSVPSVHATVPVGVTIAAPSGFAGTSMADINSWQAESRAGNLVVDGPRGQQIVVGQYTVPPASMPDGGRMAYPIAFYASAATPADAAPVDLRPSEDRSGIDLQLRPVRTARVSGIVEGPPEAVGNLFLRLLPVGLEELGQGSEAATTVTLPDGRFTFLDVPSGSYVLDATHTVLQLTYTSMDAVMTGLPISIGFDPQSAASLDVRAAPPGVELSSLSDGAASKYFGRLPVNVEGRDVDSLVLPLSRPATMTGRIVWAPGSTPSTNSLVPVLEPADGRRSLGLLTSHTWRPGQGNPSTFRFEGVMAGGYVLRIGIGTRAMVESIMWEGQDYAERPFDATTGGDINDVVMTLTTASSVVTGRVTDGGAAVIVFPLEQERWSNYGFNPTRLASVLTTSDGHFRVDGLPKGDYYFLAVPESQERAWLDPAFLAAHAGRASRIRIDRTGAMVSNVSLSLAP